MSEPEKIGKIQERVGRNLRSIKNSTTRFKCTICKRQLTWEELQDQSISFPCCEDCKPKKIADQRKKRLEEIRKNIEHILLASGVPPKYLACSFENFQTPDIERKRVILKAKEWLKTGYPYREGLFLTGKNGSGKTHLAVAAMREVILSGNTNCKFIKVPNLLFEIRRAIRSDARDAEEAIITRYLDFHLLVLDELGVEKDTEWTLQTLYLIIDGRDSYLMPTIITSNLSLKGIADKLDLRLSSRIIGMCRLLSLECEDWRKIARKRKKMAGGG